MQGQDSDFMDVDNLQQGWNDFDRLIQETRWLENAIAIPPPAAPEGDAKMGEDDDAPAEPDEQISTSQGKAPLTTEKRKAIRSERSSLNKQLNKIESEKAKLKRGLKKLQTNLEKLEREKVMYEIQNEEREKIAETEREISHRESLAVLLKTQINDLDRELREDKALRELLQQAERKGDARRAKKAKSTARPDDFNYETGDDSATDDPDLDEEENRQRRQQRIINFPDSILGTKDENRYRPPACRWCQKAKRSCDQRVPRCRECVTHQKRCRYNDPWTGKQIPAMYTVILEKKLEEANETIRKLGSQQAGGPLDFTSNSPFSGITGYGPRPMQRALENLKRIIRGLPLLPNDSETVSSDSSGPRDMNGSEASRKRKTTSTSDSDDPVPAKKVRLTGPPRTTMRREGPRTRLKARMEKEANGTSEVSQTDQRTRGAANEGAVVSIEDSHDHATTWQQVNDQEMQGAPSNARADEAQGGNEEVRIVGEGRSEMIDNSNLLPKVPYASHFAGINKKQLMYLRSLEKRERPLPLRPDHTPLWPEWAYEDEPMDDNQEECLRSLLDSGDNISGKDGYVEWQNIMR